MMNPAEVFLFLNAKRPEITRGNIREHELEDLSQLLESSEYL